MEEPAADGLLAIMKTSGKIMCFFAALSISMASQQRLSLASWAPDDPCRDRSFKEWHPEVMHLNSVCDRVTFPTYLSKVRGMTAEERADYIAVNTELIQQRNPCALQTLNEHKRKPHGGGCHLHARGVQLCQTDDYGCAKAAWQGMITVLECLKTKFAHYATGVYAPNIEASYLMDAPLLQRYFEEKLLYLGEVEYLLSMEQKSELFKSFQTLVKQQALHHDVPYPNTLSGAICESDVPQLWFARILENAGPQFGEALRNFYALPKEDKVWCATDDVMWEVNDCGAEIKKSYRLRENQGNCAAYFMAATRGCVVDEDEAIEFNRCAEALTAMQNGLECYTIRLAHDAATGFSSYDDDERMAELTTFEGEYNRLVSGGWLRKLEIVAATAENSEVMNGLKEAVIAFDRLNLIASFGC